MNKKLYFLISILIISTFFSCTKEKVDYSITGIQVQRIMIDNYSQNNKIYYLIDFKLMHNEEFCFKRPKEHLKDTLNSIIIRNSSDAEITDQIDIFKCVNDSPYKINIYPTKNSSYTKEVLTCCDNWLELIHAMQNGGLRHVYTTFIISVDKNAQQPSSLTLKLSDNEMKVKVNSTPMHYKVDSVYLSMLP